MNSRAAEGRANVGRTRLHYLKTGFGPDLLLLHGLLGTAEAWTPSLARLAMESTVYAVDALGIGRSDRAMGADAGLRATATRAVAFLDAVGVEKADVLGTSHGGAVAIAMAAEYPERVRTLVLHAPANPYSDIADPLIRFYRTPLGRWFAHRIAGLPRRLQNLALGRMYGDAAEVAEGTVDRYIDSLRVPGTVEHVLNILERWEADMRYLELAIEKIRKIPTLLLWGTRDRAVSTESAAEMQKRLPKSELVWIPRTGHLPYEEAPEMFSEAVNGFLRRQTRFGLDLGPRLLRPTSAA